MPPEPTSTDGESGDSAGQPRRAAPDDRRLDRRGLVRGAGAVLVTGALAGCYHDEGDGGGGGGGGGGNETDGGGGGGGGNYEVDGHAGPEG